MPPKRTEPKTSKAPSAHKPAGRRKRVEPTIIVSQKDIAARAYYIHLEAGHDPFENWLRAEAELATA
jgi:hypothetical protein